MKIISLIPCIAVLSTVVAVKADTLVGKALEPFIKSGELPGAISIVERPGSNEVTCAGYADVAAKRAITIDDAYMQCSQTKGFCGVTIAKLVEEGKLNLDDPVSKYLPEFKTLWIGGKEETEVDANGVTNKVRKLVKARNVLTVRMVMNHTGGFPFEISCKQGAIPGGGWSGGAPLRSTAAIAAASHLLFEPGTRVQYSNTGIDIGAAVVQTIVGKPWEQYLKETVLDPLGMKSTWFWPTDEQLKTQIEMYTCVAGKPARYTLQNPMEQRPYNDGHVFASAGAGLWTTARDQVKFYRMLMNLGLGDNGARILKEETVRNILATSSRPKALGGYSLGLAVQDDGWFGHGGAWGTNCMVNWKLKELKLRVVQLNGGPRPWSKAEDDAENVFFNAAIDNSAADAYTGRVK